MLFKAITGSPNSLPAPGADYWYMPLGFGSSSGISITPFTAMKCSAVYACVMLLAETIASITRAVYERMPDGTTEERLQHPLNSVVQLSPNPLQTAFEFWLMQIAFGCLFGNSYAEIIPGARGAVDQLVPLRPDRLKIERLESGRIRYQYTDQYTGQQRTLLQEEVFRIPGFSFNGIEGIAPIFFANDPIGLSMAVEMFASKFFKNDATPPLVLTHPGVLSPDAAKVVRDNWIKQHAGLNNAHLPAVLQEGMKVETLGKPNKDNQFAETRQLQIVEVARYLRIPPHMIGDLTQSTNNNIEQQSLEFVKFTLRPWLTKIEQRVNFDLITNNTRFYLKHDLNELMMGEMLARYQAYQIGATTGFITRNEIRKKENLNPLPGLDKPLTPLNMGGENNGQGGADNAPSPSKTPQGGKQAAGYVVRDAFERIVKSEAATLDGLYSKNADKPEKMAAALRLFYDERHQSYVAKTLGVCEDFCHVLGIESPCAADYAASYCKSRFSEVIEQTDLMVYLDNWKQQAASVLAAQWLGSNANEKL